ncbi:restriction endonuclease (plasmid) [Rhodococcus opacus]|uniref:restriction endonuclease n=1 Tax=Rhodococcus opacus TaxID=37919 RepID=UPI0034D15BC1
MDYITTAHQAELNASKVTRTWGYIDAVATTGGSDGGIEVSSRRALAQVKWRGGVAGRPDFQRLYGAQGAETAKALLLFVASGYSKQAVDYANQVGIGLFTYDPTGAVTALNAAARGISKGPANASISLPTTAVLSEWVKGDGWFIALMLFAIVLLGCLVLYAHYIV